MSKTKAITKPTTFDIDLPDDAAALGFDPNAESFSWFDVMPANYWSLELLEERKQLLGGWPVLTADKITLQQVIDPLDDNPDRTPKLVLHFAENAPAVVINKSRARLLTALTGTANPALWVERLPSKQLGIEAGILYGKAQIVLAVVGSADEQSPIDKINSYTR